MPFATTLDEPRDPHTKSSNSEKDKHITYKQTRKNIQMNLFRKQKQTHKLRHKLLITKGVMCGAQIMNSLLPNSDLN